MAWWQILISLLSGLGGTALGGYISYKTMLAQISNQREIEKEQRLQQKREELYIQACAVLMEHEKYRREHKWPQSCKDMFNELQGPMMIYASKSIYDEYYKLDREICQVYDKIRSKRQIDVKSNEMADKIEAFATKMRNELGIKGAL
ncbi:MAG: hypothetical protein K2M34_02460 [Alphaproteobacteria bacterium]|nr:hypothetical protein [Alphaproteobacteria bacterium]